MKTAQITLCVLQGDESSVTAQIDYNCTTYGGELCSLRASFSLFVKVNSIPNNNEFILVDHLYPFSQRLCNGTNEGSPHY